MRRKLIALLVLTFSLQAQDTKPLATVEQLQAKVAEQKQEIELLRADNAWLDKDRQIAYATYQACMGQRPSQAQHPRTGRQQKPEAK